MKKKLRSQSGASLILALLLFLVCAVVGSVVLTAGTAASGRLSEMAEMDQRYYAVTSAAEVLTDHIVGSKNSVEVRETETTGEDPSSAVYVIGPDNQYEKLNGSDTLVTKAAKALANVEPEPLPLNNMTLTATASGSDISALSVNVTANVVKTGDRSGKMTLTVSKAVGGGTYTLTLIFSGDIRVFVDEYEDEDSRTTITTTRVTWALSGIKTG